MVSRDIHMGQRRNALMKTIGLKQFPNSELFCIPQEYLPGMSDGGKAGLRRLFDSQLFDTWMALSYIWKYPARIVPALSTPSLTMLNTVANSSDHHPAPPRACLTHKCGDVCYHDPFCKYRVRYCRIDPNTT